MATLQEPRDPIDPPPGWSPTADLARRWTRARCAALRAVAPAAGATADEPGLVRMAAEHGPEAALKGVFENSRVLGLGFRRTYRVDLTLHDLAELLPAVGAPCHVGGFTAVEQEPACRSASTPCEAWRDVPQACDHWRESVQGLVSGLSSSVSCTRVASAAGGASSCSDLLHVDPQSPRRFMPVPPEMRQGLEAVQRLIARMDASVRVEFLGLREGVLHYRIHAGGPGSAENGPGARRACGLDVGAVLPGALRRRFPTLRVADASPRAVFTG